MDKKETSVDDLRPEDAHVTPPDVLFVDALGNTWRPGVGPGFISMARISDDNYPAAWPFTVYLAAGKIAGEHQHDLGSANV